MKAPLIGGAYEARSYIADAQRCINLYPETNAQDAPFPVTHYLTAGLTLLRQLAQVAPVRGVYTASNGELFVACGNRLYYVNSDWNATELGTIGAGNTPVSMSDNNTYLFVVDGSSLGWTVTLAGHTFAAVSDPNFLGADYVAFMDTFFLFNRPNTQQWYHSNSNSIVFNGLAIAAKTDYQDLTRTICINNQRVWVFGEQKATELWYNAGSSPFAFSQVPGVLIERSCVAKYSVATIGLAVFWLGGDEEGQGIVFRGEGQEAKRISTFAIENTIQGYATISDAVGWAYQLNGHYFYVLCFPSADATWVFDETTQLWHQWGYLDSDGVLHRHRGNCHTMAYGTHVVGDHTNGRLYKLDPEVYTDNSDPIMRLRAWPHFIAGFNEMGQPIQAEGKQLMYDSFMVEMQTGESPDTTSSAPPQITLRWSDTKGKSWGSPVTQSIGATGEYGVRPIWRKLGRAADRVFELSWSGAFTTALNGAYVESRVLKN